MTPLLFILLPAAAWLLIRWTEDRLLYRRSSEFNALPTDVGLEAEDVDFCAADGTALHGWWFPHANARGTLVICHGNAGNISDRLWMARDLADVPLNLFLFDYRGYGRSKGLPSEKGTEQDVLAAYEVAHARLGHVENPPILVYGRSLGGGIALQLATACPVRAVVLESTFTSIVEIGERFYPHLLPKLTCRNRYRSDLRIQEVEVPILIAHGPDDETIPYDMGEKLYSLAPNPFGFCKLNGCHNESGWQTAPEFGAEFRRLIDAVV